MYKMVILILLVKYKIPFMIKQQANVVLFQIKEKDIKYFFEHLLAILVSASNIH